MENKKSEVSATKCFTPSMGSSCFLSTISMSMSVRKNSEPVISMVPLCWMNNTWLVSPCDRGIFEVIALKALPYLIRETRMLSI